MLNQPTIERLRQMRLSGMAEAFAAQIKDQDIRNLSFEERFGLIVDQEWTCRQDHRLKRLLRGAKLRLPACVEDIDYQQPRGLDRSVLHALAGGGYLRGHQNVLVEGPTGVGKTFIACALANAASPGVLGTLLPVAKAPFGTDHRQGRRLLPPATILPAQGGSPGA